MSDSIFLAYLSNYSNFGPATLSKLFSYFESWENLYSADGLSLKAAGLKQDAVLHFLAWRNKFNKNIFEDILTKENISFLTISDKNYPKLLKNIKDAPLLLYYKGDIKLASEPGLAVVGSRKPTKYAKQAIDLIIPTLSQAGLIITSGLAIGVDALAHQACLESAGKTVAVLGSGLDQALIYPQRNLNLAKQIEARGLLLSEFPPLSIAFPANFPRRNRIVSGISLGVLIIEAALKSGSLITARLGLEQGREVMAIPGPINSCYSAGPNELIKNGAKPVIEPLDILENLKMDRLKPDNSEIINSLDDTEQAILEAIKKLPQTPDELRLLLNLDICVITPALTIMELNGLITSLGGIYHLK
ncbi:MAG: DNA-processing protein DprA [Patescibacteria group bacterium]|nr:DNA-processing protein DprA [Patescibacteria group bacterium]